MWCNNICGAVADILGRKGKLLLLITSDLRGLAKLKQKTMDPFRFQVLECFARVTVPSQNSDIKKKNIISLCILIFVPIKG